MTKKKDEDTWVFTDLIDSLRKSVDFSYDLERKNDGQDIPWDGPILKTCRLISCGDNIRERLAEQDPEELKFTSEQPDAMDRILACAIQLGIEQGFRMLMKERHMRRPEIRDIKTALELLATYTDDGDEHGTVRRAKQGLKKLENHIEDPGITWKAK